MADKGEKYNNKANSGGFGQYIWNPATKELLGRTGASWFKIIVFYIIFYICLAAFWALMLLIFYQTLDERYPKYQLTDSRIGANPGLGFRPRPRAEHVESTLIWFKNAKDENSWQHWSEGLTDFLKPYEKANEDDSGAHIQKCEGDKGAEEGKFCFFNIKDISNNCSAGQDFGYRRGDPCVLIKLNRIYGWKPEPFSDDDLKDKTIPDVVRSQYANRKNGSQLIYITCDGENAADKENIGPVSYYPQQGIEFKYFPFSNQPGYLSPFIFVHFSKPASGITINIECKAWAKNIKHNRLDREGSVHFELLMDGY